MQSFDELALAGYESWSNLRPPVIAVDTETTGLGWHDQAFAVTVAWDGEGHYFELSDADFPRWLKIHHILSATPQLVFHNSKFDLAKLRAAKLVPREEMTWDRIHDTETIAQLLDENRRLGLEPLTKTVLGIDTDWKEVLRQTKREHKLKKDDGYDRLPRDVLIPYAVKDAEYTFALYRAMLPELCKKKNLIELYEQERKLTLVLLDMEAEGMKIDREYVTQAAKDLAYEILLLREDIEEVVGNKEFNPNSPKQITEAFERMGIELVSTDKASLTELNHPLGNQILELRKRMKLRSTYLMPMLEEAPEGILHPNIRQHGTKTGRMSSGAASNK